MTTAVAVTAALLAALTFAVAAVLQQAAAASVPEAQSLRPRLVLSLLRRPLWLAGVGMAAASYIIQGVALAFGPLVLVMPLASTDLLFALPLIAWRRGRRITRAEAVGAACTAGGVALFLAVLPSTARTAVPGLADWLPLLVVVVVLAAALLAAGIRAPGNLRTGLYAAAAGLLFALLDALTKSAAVLFRNDGLAALGHWEPYALLAVGGTGLLLCPKRLPGRLPGHQSARHRHRGAGRVRLDGSSRLPGATRHVLGAGHPGRSRSPRHRRNRHPEQVVSCPA